MTKIKRVVVKVGTKTITVEDNKLDRRSMQEITRQLCHLAAAGVEVILVTSGAIASGMGLLGLKKKPLKLASLQAVAAIGQNHLMDIYSGLFSANGYMAAQLLLTQEDFNDRRRYLNIKYTLDELLRHRAVPVINENDTVSTEEIRCGDNDRLSSLVADLAGAEMLIMLTNVDGLLDAERKVVAVVDGVDEKILKLVRSSRCEVSTGGMSSKVEAARRVNHSGIDCVIANGRAKDVILKAVGGENIGTFFRASKTSHLARKRWIAFSSRPKGAVVVDNGARDVIEKRNKSLLPSGIVAVEGEFKAKDTISILDRDKTEFARGVANYSSEEIDRIKGFKSKDLTRILGYRAKDEVVHRDDLVIL